MSPTKKEDRGGGSWAVGGLSLIYFIAALEIVIMISPFAVFFYSAFNPILLGLNGSAATRWLTAFFLPHMIVPNTPFLLAIRVLGSILLGLGLLLFLVCAAQVYLGKLLKWGVAEAWVNAVIRHPQYTGLIMSGLGFGLRSYTVSHLPLVTMDGIDVVSVQPADASFLSPLLQALKRDPAADAMLRSFAPSADSRILAYVVPVDYVMQGMIADTGEQEDHHPSDRREQGAHIGAIGLRHQRAACAQLLRRRPSSQLAGRAGPKASSGNRLGRRADADVLARRLQASISRTQSTINAVLSGRGCRCAGGVRPRRVAAPGRRR